MISSLNPSKPGTSELQCPSPFKVQLHEKPRPHDPSLTPFVVVNMCGGQAPLGKKEKPQGTAVNGKSQNPYSAQKSFITLDESTQPPPKFYPPFCCLVPSFFIIPQNKTKISTPKGTHIYNPPNPHPIYTSLITHHSSPTQNPAHSTPPPN